jgi:hypothetical protein
MAFSRNKITSRIRRAGARYLEAMAYADPSGFVYYPVGPIVACMPVGETEAELFDVGVTPSAARREPMVAA